LVCLAGYPRNDRLPEERLNLCKWSRTGAAGCIPAGPEHCRAASQKRLLRARDRKFESISLQRRVACEPEPKGQHRAPSIHLTRLTLARPGRHRSRDRARCTRRAPSAPAAV
jgi:hypothetical protein